ncbi:MAG: NAD(+)/NADH kinase [Clostridia bacterium]|nr:NAD(+)/NADH kinase [Clostridia bacterium]
MKTVLIGKSDDYKAGENVRRIREVLQRLSIEILPVEHFQQADWVTVVGGDGTIMHTAKRAAEYDLPIFGINSGRVGFLAGLEPDEAHLLSCIPNGEYTIDSRMLLSVSFEKDGVVEKHYALNEAVVTRNGPARMMDICLRDGLQGGQINYRADGLIVATPTGSTAYSMSAGGPILDPFIEGLIVTPICPYSSPSRSLVFSPAHPLHIGARCADNGQTIVCMDGETPIDVTGREITVQKSTDRAVRLIRIKKDTFFDVYNNKMMNRNV